jgi:16S rRNA (guanine1207-N2)-methyltransferase
VAKVAGELGFTALFNDFDFTALADNSIQRVIYRVSKEKPSVHHIINQALRMLVPGGELIIAGLKNEGTKTYIDKAKNIFGQGSSQKNGLAYRGNFYKSANAPCAELLDDQDYPRLRSFNSEVLDFYSKPGLFGWDKIDQGSAFLIDEFIEQLAERLAEQSIEPSTKPSTEQLSAPSPQLPPSFPTVPKVYLTWVVAMATSP